MRTMVVVPTLLMSRTDVEDKSSVRSHFLANADGDVTFALLSDWVDAPAEPHARRTTTYSPQRTEGIARLNAVMVRCRTRRAIFLLPSPPRLERSRALVDGVGAQARGELHG